MARDKLFNSLKHHPRVCSHCFRLRHTAEEVPAHIREIPAHWANAVTETWTRTPDADRDSPPGDYVSEITPRTICECGHVNSFAQCGRTTPKTLSKPELMDYARRISDTLSELETEAREHNAPDRATTYAHDRYVLLHAVEHLKAQPGYQYKDWLILSAALEVAHEHAPEHGQKGRPLQDVEC